MSSQPSGAILNFPTGTDIYVSKTDFGVIISGESHTIPLGSPYVVSLTHVPQLGSPSLISIPGFTEVTGTPSSNQFQMQYSGTGAGNGLFSSFNAANPITVTYTTAGDVSQAEWFNSLQSSVVNIESFIGSGLGIAGNYLPVTGGSINGNVTINGGSLLTSSSGSNQIGVAGTPFANIYSNNVVANKLSSPNGLNSVSFGGSVTVSGDGSASLVSNGATNVSGNNTVVITAKNSGVSILSAVGGVEIAGHTVPTGSNTFDLGSTTKRWRKIYADEVTITSGPFVRTTGDTMTGDLVMAPGVSLNSDLISNALGDLTVNTSANMTMVSAGNVNIDSVNTSLNGVLLTNSFGIIIGTDIVPTSPSSYDIGAAGNPIRNIYADNLIGVAVSGAFVKITGDTMTGDLTIFPGGSINVDNINPSSASGTITMNVGELTVQAASNIRFATGPSGTQKLEIGLTQIALSADIIPNTSGLYDIGASTTPLRAIYADNLNIGSISSGTVIYGATLGNPTFTGTTTVSGNIIPAGAGVFNIGSSGNPFNILYANNIVTAESTGNFISKFGDTMIGTLLLGTGSNITASGSGVNNIGSLSNPFGSIWADNINSTGLNGLYVKKIGDSMSGPLVINTIYSTGTLTVSGNQLIQSAEQINLESTNGPVIIDANTEMQLLINSAANLVLNVSGTESFLNIFPDTSGTHSLGTPQRPWDAIYALNIIPVGVSGTGSFVLKIGDNMSGQLTFSSGIGIGLLQSGTSNIGSPSSPLQAIYADNIYSTTTSGAFVHITGDTMTGALTVPILSGNSILFSFISGNSNNNHIIDQTTYLEIADGNEVFIALTGTPNNYIDIANYTVIQSDGRIEISSSGGTVTTFGTDVRFGSDASPELSGTYNLGSPTRRWQVLYTDGISATGVNPNASGIGLLGTQSIPWSGLFAKNINGQAATFQVYNEIPSGTVNGINPTFTTLYTAVSGTQRLYAGGLRQTPGSSFDYQISGSMFTFTNIPPSGTNLLIDYERLAY